MTAVNNDAGSIFLSSLFLWGAIRIVRLGLSWRRLLWIGGSALLAVYTKNTSLFIVLLVPLALLLACWGQRRNPRRWLPGGLLGSLLLLAALLRWDAAAYWYDLDSRPVSAVATRVAMPAAPLGQGVLRLEGTAAAPTRVLINPLPAADVRRLAGKPVTLGGWLWAERPVEMPAIGLAIGRQGAPELAMVTQPISLTTRPHFVAWSTTVPQDALYLYYMVLIDAPAGDPDQALQLYLDGAVLVEGHYAGDSPPHFTDRHASSGEWAGRPFINLVRNGSAEQSWPALRPAVEQLLVRYLYRSPNAMLFGLLDLQRSRELLWHALNRLVLTFFITFAWGHVRVPGSAWFYLFAAVHGLATLGCLLHVRRRLRQPRTGWGMLALLAAALLLVWGGSLLRVLPGLHGSTYLPVARYLFPAIIPAALFLLVGWTKLWPRRLRQPALLLLLAGLLGLNGLAIYTIWSFYHSIPG